MRSRRILLVLGIAVALMVVTRGLAPRVLEDRLVGLAREAGLELSVRDLTLGVLSGTVRLAGLSVAETDTIDRPFLTADQASVQLRWRPLLDGRIHLAHARLARGRWLGTVDADGLRVPGQARATPTEVAADTGEAEEDAAPWPILLDLASIEALEVGLTLADGTPVDGTLNVRVEAFALEDAAGEAPPFPVSANLGIAGGRLTFEGTASTTGKVQGSIEIRDVEIPSLVGIALPEQAPWWGDGALDADLAIEAGADANVRLSGEVRGRAIAFRAPSGNGLSLEIPALTVPVERIEIDDRLVARIGALTISQPEISVRNPDPELDALLGASRASESGSSEEDARLDLRVAEIRVANGSVDLALTEPAPLELTFGELEIQVREFVASETSIEHGSVAALVDGSAPLHLDGSLKSADSGSFTGVLDGITLATFNSLIAAAGYRLEGGTASLATEVVLRGSNIDLDNEITLRDLELAAEGDAFESNVGVPLNIALALLTDLDGAIHLTVPVVIDEAGSEVALGSVLRGALQDAIVGALASPLKLIGGVASLASDDSDAAALGANKIAMRHDEILPEGEARLADWAKLLSDRPRLGVEIHGVAHADEAPDAAARTALATRRATTVRDRLATLAGDAADRIRLGPTEVLESPPGATADPSATPVAPRVGARLRIDVAL